MFGFVKTAAAVLISLACSVNAKADSAPAQLYNKTTKVSWTVGLETKAPSGQVYNVPMSVNGMLYVSTAGRIFTSASRTSARGTETNMSAPGSGRLGSSQANATFKGNQLLGTVMAASGGAVRITITFDASYANCTVSVVYGKGGKANAKYPGINEPGPYEMLSYKISNTSCAVTDGNAFSS